MSESCGCRIIDIHDGEDWEPIAEQEIVYCYLHKAAPELVTALKRIEDMPIANPGYLSQLRDIALGAIAHAEGKGGK